MPQDDINMKISTLIIGTSNPAKLKDWRHYLSDAVRVDGIDPNLPQPEETGTTFMDNATLKASYYAKLTNDFVLSDDAGFTIDALDGAPGVKSRRLLPNDQEATDQQCVDWVIEKMKNVPQENRGASLVSVAAIANPQGEIIFQSQEAVSGVVPESPGPILKEGYPFQTVLYIPNLEKTFAEFTQAEYDLLSVRGVLAKRIIEFLTGFK